MRWLLAELMERHRITNKELAAKIGRHETAVSRLRSADTLPAIGGEGIVRISIALTELLQERGYHASVLPKDLIRFED